MNTVINIHNNIHFSVLFLSFHTVAEIGADFMQKIYQKSYAEFYMKIFKKAAAALAALIICMFPASAAAAEDHIKWVDFNVSKAALQDALDFCVARHEAGSDADFSDVLAFIGTKYGGSFANYSKNDLEKVAEVLDSGSTLYDAAQNKKLYSYLSEAYGAVLDGMVGNYTEYTADGKKSEKYGLMAYSPIAEGYYYSHFDDFGAARSFGYKRNHLGHDLMGSVGTPVIAVEGGYVEACGWNMYGGWRIGIRSYDGKRYYYYAHLRKGHPYNDMYEGKQVYAGEVIGYLGMTGYSSKRDVNNINVPHLHYGMQVIFAPEQKDGWNQIWIDMYALTDFLYKNRAAVKKSEDGEYTSLRYSVPDGFPD